MVDRNIDPTELLGRFGLSSFRPGQRDVVDAIADGQDVMCVMPTGGGKSLCYQLPSLARPGTTIVVSPLIALMKDQVDALHQLGIDARLINSSLSAAEQSDVMREMADGALDLVYVAPERLRNSRFLDAVAGANVTLLAVDEAHCVSEWGHDFRPDYSRLGRFRERYLGGVQTIALTATATPTVRTDISDILALKSPKVFVTGFARPNLRLSVSHAKSDREKDQQLIDYLAKQEGAGIIYAATRKRCDELASWLPEKARRPIGVYHAGLDPRDRHQVQEDFMSGKLAGIVATNAFGMGIDKADIRYVVHYNMPGSLEAYYQEAGRAGRDGGDSDCVLLFSYNDRYVQEFFIENRYPSRETVEKVYQFLLSREEDPIELTLEQVRAAIDVKDGNESIGTAQTLLAKAGVLKRLDSASNHAIVRIDSDASTMLDFLPQEAKIRRRVMRAIEKVVGNKRHEDVYVRPSRLIELADVTREQLSRTLRELSRLKAFDYVPPFRGRAVHFTQRDLSFDELDIDFEELERRKKGEYEKLEAVIGFARSSGCRQRVILDYFGDPNAENCGTCDRCEPESGAPLMKGNEVSLADQVAGVDNDALLRGIRVVLSGVARMHGRFGKNMIAQMLCGSKNKKLQQWKLHRLSTYGMLSAMRQTEVASVIDALTEAGLLHQKEVDERRPTTNMTDDGRRVMHGQDPLPSSLRMTFPLAKRLAAAGRKIEAGDVQTQSAGQDDAGSDSSNDSAHFELAERLKRWRRKQSAALGIPAYRVLTNATVDRIAENKPGTTEELEVISGVGPATIEQFGYDIVQIVLDAAGSAPVKSIEPTVADDSSPSQPQRELASDENAELGVNDEPPSSDTSLRVDAPPDTPSLEQDASDSAEASDASDAYWTWRLFRDGYSSSQIAEIRGRAESCLVADLVIAAQTGRSIDPDWVTSSVVTEQLRKAMATQKA